MRVRATLEHLLTHFSSSSSKAKRSQNSRDDSESVSCQGSGGGKPAGASTFSVRNHVNNGGAFELTLSTSRFQSASPPVPTATVTPSLFDSSVDTFGTRFDVNYVYHYLASVESDLPLQQARAETNHGVQQWLRHVEHYLAELTRLESRGDFVNAMCNSCEDRLKDSRGIRCGDCHDQALYCLPCTLAIHERLPLHRVQMWTGDRFEHVPFSQLNLRVYLGHGGGKCPNPNPEFSESFVVLDISGFHQVAVQFCGCQDAVPPYAQLLRQRWFPSVCQGAHTAATFRTLDHFHLLSSQSNVSALEYYHSLLRMTNNAGVDPPKNQLSTFLVMIREWNLLKTLKRAGTGNHQDGIHAPRLDDYTVDCPACSYQMVDPPDGPAEEPQKTSWLDRLALITRSTERGRLNPSQTPTSQSDHTAARNLHGFSTVRGPHDVERPKFGLEYFHEKITFSKSPFASSIALLDDVPHIDQNDICPQQSQSSHIREFLRQIDMDAVTRGASKTWTNAGLYGDLLDSTIRTGNWDKVTALPMSLLLDAEIAISERRVYDKVYNALTSFIPSDYVDTWLRIALDWEAEGCESPSPFDAKYSHLTRKAVRADLYREDLAAIQHGEAMFVGLEEDTPSTIIAMGLDLEEEQRRIHSTAITDLQPQSSGSREMRLVEKQSRLRRRIGAWHDSMQLLSPTVASLRTQPSDVAGALSSWDMPLFFPSTLCSGSDLPNVQLLHCEWRLREAQAYDSLADLRGHLQVIEYIRSCSSQSPDDEDKIRLAGLIINVVHTKICMDVQCYRAAYVALKTLAFPLNKVVEDGFLYELKDHDVQYISRSLGPNGPTVPWIWRFGQTAFVDPAGLLDLDVNCDLKFALCIEWCEARTHARTSSQLCKSIKDNMHRAIAYHQHRARWWESQVGQSFADCPDDREGADSYACRQASIRHSMKEHCSGLWSSITDCLSSGPHDPDEPLITPTSFGKQD